MQEAVYYKFRGSQPAAERKLDLSSSPYYTIPVLYGPLRSLGYDISHHAYDLYVTLLLMKIHAHKEKIKATVPNLMFMSAFTCNRTYQKAKNSLLETDLLQIYDSRGHNQINTFIPKLINTSSFLVPHTILYWLNDCVRQKQIPRAAKMIWLHLYRLFVLENYPEELAIFPVELYKDLNIERRTFQRLMKALQQNSYLSFSSSLNQHIPTLVKLFIPENLSLPIRDGAPRPILPRSESQARLTEIIAALEAP